MLNVPRCSILLIIAAVGHWDTKRAQIAQFPVNDPCKKNLMFTACRTLTIKLLAIGICGCGFKCKH